MTFRERLQAEFAERKQRSPRYSLRAFARFLGTDHATLSQLLRGRRHLTPRMATLLGRRLGFSSAEIAEARLEQNAEAILRVARSPSFRPDSRWIATRTGLPVDTVNASLDRLIRHGALVMASTTRWRALPPPYAPSRR